MQEPSTSEDSPSTRFGESESHTEELINLSRALEGQPGGTSLAEDAELLRDFLLESREHLAAVEKCILELERDPAHSEALHATFRAFHTIKGLAGFLGFAAIQEVSHEIETLLDLARESSMIAPPAIDAVLRATDYLTGALEQIGQTGATASHRPPEELLAAISCAIADDTCAQKRSAQSPEAFPSPNAESFAAKSGAAVGLKIDAEKIEHLIDMAGELVIAQSMVRQNPAIGALADASVARQLGQLSRVTAEVQKIAMSMRMAPVSGLFHKMARVVRDVARKAGKEVALEVVGEDAHMDRKILDGLYEPLLHMVRNAVDHGLEPPEERLPLGKPRSGKIRLRAERESGNIVIEISDDGRGLNTSKIRAKAIERGLISDQGILAVDEIHRLIFEPGFSTAEKLSEFSGRGVGMDVVRKQVEALRGGVEISSWEGRGTRFTVRVPLTLATLDGLLVRVGEERYILPTFVVSEIFQAGAESIFTVAGKSEMVRVRNSTVPVIRLADRLRTRSKGTGKTTPVMVLVRSGARQFCLAADEVIGKQEVVIKNLGSVFRNHAGVAGGAILGDGRVGLILDIEGLLQTRYRVNSTAPDGAQMVTPE